MSRQYQANTNHRDEFGTDDLDQPAQRSQQARVSLEDGIKSLNQLSASLMGAVETLEMPELPPIGTGIDFYEELRRFQVSLIRRALNKTGGSQVRAAALLKMKSTTLNSKIKQFRIDQ